MNGGLHRYDLRRAGFLLSACLGVFLTAAPALSQPNQTQINAVRQNCRSDYMAHCSSVPPSGADSLNCLQNNSARLSASCRSAVDALKPAAATPAAKPAAAAPPPAPAAAPAPERTAAPVRAPAATAAAPAQQQQPRTRTAKPPPSRQAPPPRTAAAPGAAPAAAPPEPAWVYVPMPPLLPRVQLASVRACDGDRQAVCSMVPLGGGRVIECLARNEPTLTPFCRQTLVSARASAAR